MVDNAIIKGPIHYSDDSDNEFVIPAGVTIEYSGKSNKVIIKEGGSYDLFLKCLGNTTVKIGDNCSLSGLITCWASEYILIMGDNCVFSKIAIDFHHKSKMIVNSKSTFNWNNKFSVGSGMSIEFGEDCMFAENVTMLCGDCHSIFDVSTGKKLNPLFTNSPKDHITIGNHVWVCKNSTILSGSYIGDGSIIAAGAVVKITANNNTILAGVPAKVIKKNIAWNRDPAVDSIESCGKYAKLTED